MNAGSIELEAKLIERIVERRNELMEKADERALMILEAAEKEKERIRVESEKQVLNIVGSELRAVRDRIVGSMELEGRKILMNSRDELFTSVFDEAEKRLWEIASGRDETVDFGKVLLNLIIEAATAMGGEEFIVAANERDIMHLRENLKEVEERLKETLGDVVIQLDSKPIATMGGVVVQNRDGDKIFYNTLEGRLRSVRGRIEAEVGKVLGVL